MTDIQYTSEGFGPEHVREWILEEAYRAERAQRVEHFALGDFIGIVIRTPDGEWKARAANAKRELGGVVQASLRDHAVRAAIDDCCRRTGVPPYDPDKPQGSAAAI